MISLPGHIYTKCFPDKPEKAFAIQPHTPVIVCYALGLLHTDATRKLEILYWLPQYNTHMAFDIQMIDEEAHFHGLQPNIFRQFGDAA